MRFRRENARPAPNATSSRGRLGRLLEARQGQGKLVFALDEFAQSAALSPLAARRQFEQLGSKVTRLPGRPSLYLTVPPEDRPRGAPPVAAWLHDYMSHRAPHYYVGLLTAAALHGSQDQVPMSTQVIVPVQLRPFAVGRLQLQFFNKHSASCTPLAQLPGLPAPLNVSTPDATLLDLITFSSRIGGMGRVAEIGSGLLPKLTAQGLKAALVGSDVPVPVAQRAGYLLENLGAEPLARIVEKSLSATFAPVLLQVGKPVQGAQLNERWCVLDNVHLHGSGT